jgi:hypothetical protein
MSEVLVRGAPDKKGERILAKTQYTRSSIRWQAILMVVTDIVFIYYFDFLTSGYALYHVAVILSC